MSVFSQDFTVLEISGTSLILSLLDFPRRFYRGKGGGQLGCSKGEQLGCSGGGGAVFCRKPRAEPLCKCTFDIGD